MEILDSNEETYFCAVCNRHLPIVDGVVVHDDIEHPEDMIFEEQEEHGRK